MFGSGLRLVFLSTALVMACGESDGDEADSTSFVSLSGDTNSESGAETASESSTSASSSADASGDGDGEGEAETEGEETEGEETEGEETEGEGTAEAGLSCEECWMLHCATERTDCEAETDCSCVMECVDAGGSPGTCKNECGVQGNPAGWGEWQDCLDTNCSGAC